jgi:hypothetical protein
MTAVAAPDAVEAVIGWRAWTIAKIDGRFRLQSVVAPTVWQPLEVLEAACLRPGIRLFRRWSIQHEAPWTGCECGIYATNSPSQVATYASETFDSERRVLGRVALWGIVAQCERGWRASQAYPCEIVIPEQCFTEDKSVPLEALAFDLTDYGVPVRLIDETELVALMHETSPGHVVRG